MSTPPQAEASLLDKYLAVRETSLQICAPLTVEDHSLQPMPDASPAKWHLAHTTWFFETFLLSAQSGYFPFHPAFRNLFNSYYNAVGDRPLRNLRHILSRPGLDEVHAYRSYVDDAVVHMLTTEPAPEFEALVTLGINHEQQHQELIVTDVKNGLWTNPLRPAFRPTPEGHHAPSASASVSPIQWRSFDEGIYSVRFCGRGIRLRQRRPAAQCLSGTISPGLAPGHQRRVSGIHARQRLRHRRAVALRRMGHGAQQSVERSVVLGAARRRLVELHRRRHDAVELERAGLSRQLLRGRRLRTLGGRAAAYRIRVGSCGAILPGGGKSPGERAICIRAR